jgi:hypothetical protein
MELMASTDERQVLCSVVKWCWNRLPGGVVGWEAYELFRVGETGMFKLRPSSLLTN